MDYIKQLNAFYSQMEYNPVSANASALWNALMHIANKTRWLEYFTVANKTLEVKSGLETSSLQRARNELVQKKLLIYKKGNNKHSLATYKLPVLYEQVGEQVNTLPAHNEQVDDTVNAQVNDIVSEQAGAHINKQKHKQNKNENKTYSIAASTDGDIVKAIIDHLNFRTGAKFKYTSKATVSHIKARLNEGYDLEKFVTVIDKKVFEWVNKPEMAVFLRPQTLFGSKFEAYLNQPWTDGSKTSQTRAGLIKFAVSDTPSLMEQYLSAASDDPFGVNVNDSSLLEVKSS